MRLNPVPWLFAPGVALGGWLADGGRGVVRWLLVWALVVTLATLVVVLRRRFGGRQRGRPPR